MAAAVFQWLIFVTELLLLYLSPQGCNDMFLFSSVSQKRASEDTTSSSPPKKASAGPKRDARQIYNPPSGKYSSNLGSFSYGKLGSLEKLRVVTVVSWGGANKYHMHGRSNSTLMILCL